MYEKAPDLRPHLGVSRNVVLDSYPFSSLSGRPRPVSDTWLKQVGGTVYVNSSIPAGFAGSTRGKLLPYWNQPLQSSSDRLLNVQITQGVRHADWKNSVIPGAGAKPQALLEVQQMAGFPRQTVLDFAKRRPKGPIEPSRARSILDTCNLPVTPPAFLTPRVEMPKAEMPRNFTRTLGVPDGYSPSRMNPGTDMPKFYIPRLFTPKPDMPKFYAPEFLTPRTDMPKFYSPTLSAPTFNMPRFNPPTLNIPRFDPPRFNDRRY